SLPRPALLVARGGGAVLPSLATAAPARAPAHWRAGESSRSPDRRAHRRVLRGLCGAGGDLAAVGVLLPTHAGVGARGGRARRSRRPHRLTAPHEPGRRGARLGGARGAAR